MQAEDCARPGCGVRCDLGLDLGVTVTFGEHPPAGDFDAVLDLTGGRAVVSGRVIRPTFDGETSEAALWGALLDHRPPRLGLEIAGSGIATLRFRPSSTRTRSDVRPIRCCRGSCRFLRRSRPTASMRFHTFLQALTALRRGLFAYLRGVVFRWDKVADKAARALKRRLDTSRAAVARWLAACAGEQRPARSTRFPRSAPTAFCPMMVSAISPIRSCGCTRVCVMRSSRSRRSQPGAGSSRISRFRRTGRRASRSLCWRRAHHLSYPQIIAHRGQVYMMPECSASGAVTVYRAGPVPASLGARVPTDRCGAARCNARRA